MWVNMNFLGVIYIARNQQAFLAQMTSFVVRYALFIDLKLSQTNLDKH